MARSIQAITGIVGVLIISAIIALGFIAGVADSVQAETNRQVEIENKTMMMKLILYDSMIAYGCEVGGHISDDTYNSRYWGTHKDLIDYAENPSTISFSSLNASMPRSFKGLPCTGVGFTLPETGGPLQDSTPVSKEWRDDQEGKPSRIKFKIEKDITLPKCFVHYTAGGEGVDVDSGAIGQYVRKDSDEVTNSWFLMSNSDQHSVFKPGPDPAGDVNCEPIHPDAPNGKLWNPNSDVGNGPAMNVEVLENTVGGNLQTSSSGSVSNPSPFLESIEIHGFKFEKGTTGFVQTNTGCKSQNPAHSISDTPGMSGREFKSDTCDNKLHPFIAITSTP